MKKTIQSFIIDYVKTEDEHGLIPNIWREPLVRFGDVKHPELEDLRRLVHPEHVIPRLLFPEARTIIAYFIPFTKAIGDSNIKGRLSSKEWAMAYEKTNAAISRLNEALIEFLKTRGIRAAVPVEAGWYDESVLKSKWSYRHIARLCGLGTFGKNNMLITEAGCCGRLGVLVTDLDIAPDVPIVEEYCLYKKDGSCGACIPRCPSEALSTEGYDRFVCNALCGENAEVHVGYGTSYKLENTNKALTGTNTCGKCVVGLPCTYGRP
ncbi:MAG: epoxyqueuosine reductase, partial [Eubacterium sp.]